MIARTRTALVAAALLFAAACTGATHRGQAGSVVPGTLRIGETQPVLTLDPLDRDQPSGTDLDLLVYGFFFNLDDKMRYVPELAEAVPTYANGGISKDGLTLTYRLRRGVRWHDGRSFSSADVVATTHAILDPKRDAASRAGWDDIASVEAEGPYEVRFRLKKIYAPAIATFFCESGMYPVLAAHVLAEHPDGRGGQLASSAVGTGPFRVVAWASGTTVELAANPGYWRGRPKLDRIVVTYAPPQTILRLLRQGELDAWMRPPPALYAALRDLPGFRVQTVPSLVYTHLDLNEKNPLFDDVRVRRAINDAIDKRAIIAGAAHGLADPATSDISPLSWAYDPDAAKYPYDPAAARALLADAGWTAGGDGMVRKGGRPLTFSIAAAAGAPTSAAIEVELREQLRKVGIDAKVKNYPSARLFASYGDGGVLYRGDYEAALFSWVAGADPDDSSEYMCGEIPPAGQNDLYWCDDALDAAERGALSSYDRSVRKRYYAAVQEELASQSVTIVLYFNRQVVVTSSALRGFVPAPAASSNWNTWEWSV